MRCPREGGRFNYEHGQKLCDILKLSKFSVFLKNEITPEQKAE